MLYTHFITKFWKTFKIKTWSKIYVTRTWLSCHMLWLRTLLLLFGCLVAQSCPTLWTLWTVSSQAPLSMGFSRQEYWSGLPYPTLRDLPYPGIELHLLCLLHWQAGSLLLVPPGKPVSAAAAKSLQSCPTLCDPVDGSPPGSSVHGLFQTRILEWAAISFSKQ